MVSCRLNLLASHSGFNLRDPLVRSPIQVKDSMVIVASFTLGTKPYFPIPVPLHRAHFSFEDAQLWSRSVGHPDFKNDAAPLLSRCRYEP